MSESPVEVETGPRPTGSVIWLHGLGADGYDFAPLVPELMRIQPLALRFIFPHAPLRPVTVNNGYVMRAWYDILNFDREARQDLDGIRSSDKTIRGLIARENERGIANRHIVLAGFSQGGAMTLYTGTRLVEPLAGLVVLSSYLLQADEFARAHTPATLDTPVLLVHGKQDPVLPFARGVQARDALMAAGYRVQWHAYDMPHSVCPEEVAVIAGFLGSVLATLA